MDRVYVLQHVRSTPQGDDAKLIGVYRSRSAAEQAVWRLRGKPGFKDAARIVDLSHEDSAEGFQIDEYPLDKDYWVDGFVTLG
jgi:hypothetical protein